MGEKEEERRALIHEFYKTYRHIQKRHNLRYHMHFDIFGKNLIEIWEYIGEQRGKCICKVKEENEAACYKRAIEELKNYGQEREGATYAKRAG